MKDDAIIWAYDSEIVGDCGEVVTASSLRSVCGMQIIRNLYVPYENGFTEVDMIGLSEYGVYVVENKNIHSIVRGSFNDEYWSYGVNFKKKLYNPIKQNRIHCRALRDIIGNSVKLRSLVMFNDSAILNIDKKSSNYVFLLKDFVNTYRGCTLEGCICEKDILELYELLKGYSDPSPERRRQHVASLRMKSR